MHVNALSDRRVTTPPTGQPWHVCVQRVNRSLAARDIAWFYAQHGTPVEMVCALYAGKRGKWFQPWLNGLGLNNNWRGLGLQSWQSMTETKCLILLITTQQYTKNQVCKYIPLPEWEKKLNFLRRVPDYGGPWCQKWDWSKVLILF
jgi:hypothetical protein